MYDKFYIAINEKDGKILVSDFSYKNTAKQCFWRYAKRNNLKYKDFKVISDLEKKESKNNFKNTRKLLCMAEKKELSILEMIALNDLVMEAIAKDLVVEQKFTYEILNSRYAKNLDFWLTITMMKENEFLKECVE